MKAHRKRSFSNSFLAEGREPSPVNPNVYLWWAMGASVSQVDCRGRTGSVGDSCDRG